MKITLIILITAMLSFSACASTNNRINNKLIFLHGANLNANSWNLLINDLAEYKSISINLPGRVDNIAHKLIDLNYSAKSLCTELSKFDEGMTIVAHSQAGAILNHSLSLCPNVKIAKIIYIASVVPLDGEKVFEKLNKEDEKHYFSGIEYDEVLSSLIINKNEEFIKSFAGPVSVEEKNFILASAVSEPAPIGKGVVGLNSDKFNSISKYYVRTLKDKIISIESQEKIIRGINFKTIYSMNTGHLPMVTNYKKLSKIIRTILN